MDAQLTLSSTLSNLRNLCGEQSATAVNPKTEEKVQAFISRLQDLEGFLSENFKDELQIALNKLTSDVLKSVYSAEEATGTFITTKQRLQIDQDRGNVVKSVYSVRKMIGGWREIERLEVKNKQKRLKDAPKSNEELFIKKMKKINSQVESLLQRANNKSTNKQNHKKRIDSKEKMTVPIDPQDLMNKLVNLLVTPLDEMEIIVREEGINQPAQIVAVVGEGGFDRTNLAREVYDRVDVRQHFFHRAWIRVSSVFNARKAFGEMLTQMGGPAEYVSVDSLSQDALMRRVVKVLEGKTFLIVLEDADIPEAWVFFHRAISSLPQSGKIVITTRKLPSDVRVDARSTIQVCRLEGTEEEDLFLTKVGWNKKLKTSILKLCSSMIDKRRNFSGLERLLDDIGDKENGVILSYYEFPLEMRICFLFMGLFPRGFEIPARKLIHLWCAEGLIGNSPIPGVQAEEPEDIGELYLKELAGKNMVEVKWRSDGRPKTCFIPNVVYDFFTSKTASVGFLCHHQFWTSFPKQQNFAVRRLAVCLDGINNFHSSFHSLKHLRSFIAFDNRIPITSYPLGDIFKNRTDFGSLFVLDLEGVYKPDLGPHLSKMFQLRYLGLKSTFMDEYLDLRRFVCLETLDIRHTNINSNVLELRHIYTNTNHSVPYSTNLRTLWGPTIDDSWDQMDFAKLLELKNLKNLKLTLSLGTTEGAERTTAEWINQLSELQSLKLTALKGRMIELQLAEHHKLQELYLVGSIKDVGFLPPNVRKLTLSLSWLEVDPMPILGNFPHLNILRLYGYSYSGRRITCSSGSFPKLRVFKLWNSLFLQFWMVEDNAMPCLRELEIRSCKFLDLPQGLENLVSLEEVVLTNMSHAFENAIQESLQSRDIYIRKNTWNPDPSPNMDSSIKSLNQSKKILLDDGINSSSYAVQNIDLQSPRQPIQENETSYDSAEFHNFASSSYALPGNFNGISPPPSPRQMPQPMQVNNTVYDSSTVSSSNGVQSVNLRGAPP